MFHTYYRSPIGLLHIQSNGAAITHVSCVKKREACVPDALTTECERELVEYFRGKRHSFDLPLDAAGTSFQKKVWRAMTQIPYGKSTSYADLARSVGKPKAPRAIGSACGKNPILIITPCHRVIASDGSLGGFSAGTKNKILLQSLEKESV